MAQDEEDVPEHKLSRQEAALLSTLRQNIARYRQQLTADFGGG